MNDVAVFKLHYYGGRSSVLDDSDPRPLDACGSETIQANKWTYTANKNCLSSPKPVVRI